MTAAPLQPQTLFQQHIAQLALELAARLEAQAQQAPRGGILDACEALLLNQGRQFLRDSLAAALQQQIDDAEKKGVPPAPVPVATPADTKAPARAISSPPSATSR